MITTDSESSKEQIEAPFSMSTSTLKRVDNTLVEFKNLLVYGSPKADIRINTLVEKQVMAIGLAEQVFLSSAPLLSSAVVDELKIKMEGIQPKVKSEVKSGLSTGKKIYAYSRELDKKIREFVLEVTLELQKKGYFMPSADEQKWSKG